MGVLILQDKYSTDVFDEIRDSKLFQCCKSTIPASGDMPANDEAALLRTNAVRGKCCVLERE